jgi:hypothetical protein
MKRTKHSVLAAAMLILFLLASCGVRGPEGQTFLALNWTSLPQAMNFPAFPSTIFAGEYINHPAGDYFGEYIAWDGSYWNASYWIEVEEGSPGFLFIPGGAGDEYYLSMWLYSFGPSIYTDGVISRSVSPAADQPGASAEESQLTASPEQQEMLLSRAREKAAGMEPVIRSESIRIPGATVHVHIRGYDLQGSRDE